MIPGILLIVRIAVGRLIFLIGRLLRIIGRFVGRLLLSVGRLLLIERPGLILIRGEGLTALFIISRFILVSTSSRRNSSS